MCSIIGVGEKLHKVLGQVDLCTLDSGERSLPFGLLVLTILVTNRTMCQEYRVGVKIPWPGYLDPHPDLCF